VKENRPGFYAARLILMFGIAFSLAVLPGSLSSPSQLPRIPMANACVGCVANSSWYPSGPAMNTELVNIFSTGAAEISALCAGSIDLTDIPTASLPCSNAALTTPVSSHDYFEIEFNLGNNFWGVPFQFGNNASGVQIRQGIAHLFDKNVFVNTDPAIAGGSISIDNPLPTSNGGLPAAIPCGWDQLSLESGSNCVVSAAGGLAYHLAPASGLCGNETVQAACQFAWMQGFGSSDFCAAAQHFIAAGLATGKDTNCVLTGVKTASLVSHPVDFIAKSDRPARYHLATGLTEDICALFTGSFTVGCISGSPGTGCTTVLGASLPANAIICLTPVTLYPDCVFDTPPTSVNVCWGMYTGGFGGVFPFDSSLYFLYNSLFVSGGSFDHPPCAATTAVTYPSNYMYMCVPSYDSISTQIEFAPCLSASGDPVPGQTSPTFADCPGTTKLTGVSAGYQTEDVFGRGAYTIPLYSDTAQFAYLSNWSRVINADGVGLPNFFTWLNAYSPSPAVSGTIRQGFSQSTSSLNPYTAATAQDFYILDNIYDTLYKSNPLSPTQIMDWMTTSDQVLNNTMLGYTPPAGTVASIRNTLRNSLFWHDGAPVTAWDAEFSLLTINSASGCLICPILNPMVGVHVLNRFQFDINLKSIGPFTKLGLASTLIIPGRHWSTCGEATWDADVASGSVPSSCMSVFTCITACSPIFDPLAGGILIGSGPWMCKNLTTGIIGGGCSSTGFQNPPAGGSYTLTRFGAGFPPASSPTGSYFRSSGLLALWIWTGNTGSLSNDFVNFSQVAFCYNKPLGTTGCTHWQQGIGASGGSSVIGIHQLSEVAVFFLVSWTHPYLWTDLTNIGFGPGVSLDGIPAPVLYEGSAVLNPASVAGCSLPYPAGGYDC